MESVPLGRDDLLIHDHLTRELDAVLFGQVRDQLRVIGVTPSGSRMRPGHRSTVDLDKTGEAVQGDALQAGIVYEDLLRVDDRLQDLPGLDVPLDDFRIVQPVRRVVLIVVVEVPALFVEFF